MVEEVLDLYTIGPGETQLRESDARSILTGCLGGTSRKCCMTNIATERFP